MMNKLIVLPIVLAIIAAAYLGYSTPLSTREVAFQAPAITDNGEGTMASFKLFLRPGEGRTLVNIDNALYREDSENSLRKAKAIAERFVGLKMTGYDLVLEVDGGERIVGGESAGMLFTAAIVSAYSGRKLHAEATGSAAVSEEGKLLPIDGVEEKMHAASQVGKKYFVVCKDQQINREAELSKIIQIVRVENAGEAIRLLLE